ncbi:Hpt domain-containing protein [Luteibaculum oceani]|uniref:Hpt domain-containing protein n=1 Tax=Luteibaculum oceani TaxID=1294296 RepID=A0A5C6VJU7_9FLAO|nr:Hpt domain-containing protein [Luteibaculum oceani]TXC85270.1 Hpt domain-containing protein [Luteibaculum oceani]
MGLDLSNADEIGGQDPEFLKELMEVYIRRFPEYHDTLEQAIKEKNLEEMASRLHRVKSAASVLGYKNFCAELRDAENYCLSPEAKLDKALELSEDLLAKFKVSLKEVEQHLKSME